MRGGGYTAAHLAAAEGHIDVISALIAAGASINLEADDGETPMGTAIRVGRGGVYRTLSSILSSKEDLVEAPVTIHLLCQSAVSLLLFFSFSSSFLSSSSFHFSLRLFLFSFSFGLQKMPLERHLGEGVLEQVTDKHSLHYFHGRLGGGCGRGSAMAEEEQRRSRKAGLIIHSHKWHTDESVCELERCRHFRNRVEVMIYWNEYLKSGTETKCGTEIWNRNHMRPCQARRPPARCASGNATPPPRALGHLQVAISFYSPQWSS